MDENKITPELDNVENADEVKEESAATDSADTAEVIAETVDETAEAGEEVSTEDADIIENPVTEEEVELGQPETPKKKKRKGLKIVLGIIIAIILGFVALVVAAYVSMNSDAKLGVDVDEPAITVDDIDVNAGEYLYTYSYFANYYSSYYTADQLQEYATEQIIYVNSLYKKAVEKGYTLSDEDYAEINEVLASVEEQAEAYSITADEMIEQYYFCEGYTVDMFKKYLEKEYLANKYYADEVEVIQSGYEGDKAVAAVEKEYNSDRTMYDLSNASYVYFAATDEGIDEKVAAIVSKVESGKTFAEAVDSAAEIKSLSGYTKSVVETKFSAEVADWLFSIKDNSYVNGAGAVTSIVEGEVIYIVYVDDEPGRDEQIPVTVDYIVVKSDTDTTVKSEDELLLAAKAKATTILNEFEGTKKTTDDFFALQDTYNNAGDSLISGNYFEDMVNDGTYDDAVAAWAFDSARQVGDYALVAGDGCYYVLFFTQKDENPVWYQNILDALLTDAVSSWSEEIIKSFEDATVMHEDVINAVVEYIGAKYSGSSY